MTSMITTLVMLLVAMPVDDKQFSLALRALSNPSQDTQQLSVADALGCIEATLSGRTDASWSQAFDALCGPGDSFLRIRLLQVCTKLADAQRASELLRRMNGVVKSLEDRVTMDLHLVSAFLREMEVPSYWSMIRDNDETAEFLGNIISWKTKIDPEPRRRAAALLKAVTCRTELKNSVVIRAFDSYSKMDRLWEPLIPLLQPSMFAELRRIARTGSRPNRGAFSALAHFGDNEIVPDLQALTSHEAAREFAERCLWQINVQQSTESLLGRIATETGMDETNGQLWAMQRATEKGIDKLVIRDAVLRCASTSKPLFIAGKECPGEMGYIKKRAIALGILYPTDLPHTLMPPDIDP